MRFGAASLNFYFALWTNPHPGHDKARIRNSAYGSHNISSSKYLPTLRHWFSNKKAPPKRGLYVWLR